MPAWINPWGLVASLLSALALLAAPVDRLRSLTIVLSALGVAVVLLGIPVTWWRRNQDWAWLGFGGALSGAVLLLALFRPGLLNPFWAIDLPTEPPPDPNRLTVIPRGQPNAEGKPLAPEDWVDASREVIRQREMLIRLPSVKTGALMSKTGDVSGPAYLLIRLSFYNTSHSDTITIHHFDNEKHKPVLTDDSGHSYPFIEQRPRYLRAGGSVVFLPSNETVGELQPPRYLDYLLVFQMPPAGLESLQLELPASAWGRKGVCRFRIPRFFDTVVP